MVGTRSRKTRPDEALGKLLRETRIGRKLKLESVSADLNIPMQKLEALEEGDFSVFAAEIYARGACMKYASYLGIEKEVSERAVWRAVAAARQMVPLKLHVTLTFFERLLHPRITLFLALGVIGVTIGGYIVWQMESYLQLPALSVAVSDELVVTDPAMNITGVSEPDSRVSVNGQPVMLRPDNSFEVQIVLRSGINVIQAQAENTAGRKRIVEKHVLLANKGEGF